MTASSSGDANKGALSEIYVPKRWTDLPFLGFAKNGPAAPTQTLFGSTGHTKTKMVAGDSIYFDFGQFPHSWAMTPVRPHVHFSSDDGGTGNVVWTMSTMCRSVTGLWTMLPLVAKTWAGTLLAGGGALLDLWDSPGVDLAAFTGSSVLMCSNLTLTSKTFSGRIFIDGWDIHYEMNRAGTVGEFA